jgi:hypothetical protein
LTATEAAPSTPSPETTTGATQTAPALPALVAQAGRDFADYQRLTSEGKLADAGQKLDDLKRVLNELNSRVK